MAVSSRKDELFDRIDSLLDDAGDAADPIAFFDDLGTTLEMAVLFSEDQPTDALDVLWHFIERLPAIFGVGFEADELTDICTFLAEDTLRVAARERLHLSETIERLLLAYVDERDADGHFAAMPEVLSNPKLPKRVRELAGSLATQFKGRTPEQHGWLAALATNAKRTSA